MTPTMAAQIASVLSAISLILNVVLGFLHQNLRNQVQNQTPTPGATSPAPVGGFPLNPQTIALLSALANAQNPSAKEPPVSTGVTPAPPGYRGI